MQLYQEHFTNAESDQLLFKRNTITLDFKERKTAALASHISLTPKLTHHKTQIPHC